MSPDLPVLRPLLPERAGERLRWGAAHGCARALALAVAARERAAPLVLIAPDPRSADQAAAEIEFFAGPGLPVMLFPDSETLPYDAFSPHPDITSRRLAAMARLPDLGAGVVVVAQTTLMQRLPPPAWVAGSALDLSVGERLDLEAFRGRLAAAGYAAVPQVTEHGEFAVRGSLLDVFPMGAGEPYRLDLFDEEIESIRSFDPETQRSRGRLDALRLLPAREFPFDEDAVRRFRERFRERFPLDLSRVQVYRDVTDGILPGGLEYYLPLFFDSTATLFDYLPGDSLVVVNPDLQAGLGATWEEIAERYEQLRHDIEQPRLPPESLFAPPGEIEARLEEHPVVELSPFEFPDAPRANLEALALPPVRLSARDEADGPSALGAFLDSRPGRVLFTAESPGRREMLKELLAGRGLRTTVLDGWEAFLESDAPLGLAVAALEEGARLTAAGIAIVPEAVLFGERVRQKRRRRRRGRDAESVVRELADLAAGAPVVHADHGVGRYLGLQTLGSGGHAAEFLTIEYAGGDRLYVPVQSLDLVSRYTGASPETAPLHRLGSDQWQKARRKAAARVRDVAAELLDIYARRAARQGREHRYDEREYRAFCEAFPFEETADQDQAIADVVTDLAAPAPMDRVVCGDVGFGKTEVALRAAFVAVQAGSQVALLVPTTLLAQQHYQTFSDRFADWPVRVEVLSRFRSPKQARAILGALAEGKVDILVGTHRLLQEDVRFDKLGLVIVDEEHRFGVRHKERLKKLRAEVDMLTLTATPIPRTLNMAMGGLRDLSLITTPPSERLAVKTFVTDWKDAVIREACLREIRRGGQIYFLHNKVETIERAAQRIGALVPEARIRIAHGQMRERDLEQIMLDFYHRRFNLLVCTTIIESGLDVPTANTIIMDRADKLGLAQLHQLRGRVGRSHHRAYAYLITPPGGAMTDDARKRLEAIESLEELGAGFMLATHDLEIRGAGELLGDEQSGQIHEIGFSLYAELLKRAVAAMKAGREPELERPLDHGTEVEMGVAALLPDDYVPDVHERLVLYKRIASARDAEALRDLQVELIDRFGLLPEPAKTLFRVAEVRQKASRLGVAKLDAGHGGGRLVFAPVTEVDPVRLVGLVQGGRGRYRLDGQDKLRFNQPLEDVDARFAAVHELLDRLTPDSQAA